MIKIEATNWVYNFDKEFPVHIFPFTVSGSRDNMHWHDYVEIGVCTKGGGYFIYMNKEYNVSEGDIFISNNNESHVAITDEGEEAEYVFLIFLPEFIAHPHGREFDLNYLSVFNYEALSFVNKIDHTDAFAERIKASMIELLSIYSGNMPFRKMKIDIIVRQILLELSLYYSSSSKETHSAENPVHPKIAAAIEYINNHYNEPISADIVATNVDLNPSYFRHLFKASTHLTFKTYVTHLRLSKVRSLLLSTDTAVTEIISSAGFSNASQFYKTFTSFSRMTPSQFRKYYKKV